MDSTFHVISKFVMGTLTTGRDVKGHQHRGVEKLVSHRAHNPEAAGSNPAPATNKARLLLQMGFFD